MVYLIGLVLSWIVILILPTFIGIIYLRKFATGYCKENGFLHIYIFYFQSYKSCLQFSASDIIPSNCSHKRRKRNDPTTHPQFKAWSHFSPKKILFIFFKRRFEPEFCAEKQRTVMLSLAGTRRCAGKLFSGQGECLTKRALVLTKMQERAVGKKCIA